MLTAPALPAFAVQRLLTDRLLTFVDATGIARHLAARDTFTACQALEALHDNLGYAVGDPTRARMIRVLIDFLVDCDHVTRSPDGTFRWNPGAPRPWRPGETDEARIQEAFDGQVEFFEQCLQYADRFLQGRPPLFDFNSDSTRAWERLLGNGEFAFARSVLSRLLLPRARDRAETLVLCYGPGYDLVEIERRRPDARVTALDFTNAFFPGASRRLTIPGAVNWVDAAEWGGFGTPLPFAPLSFDIVLFACADPYIQLGQRAFVYGDIHRVLRPGGVLGVLTHSYPDAARRFVADEWVRRGTFCHDFLESVCQGWQGFYDAGCTRDQFARAGFCLEVVTLNASVWRLAKPEAP
jgi:SAM-dependent methyltransferase